MVNSCYCSCLPYSWRNPTLELQYLQEQHQSFRDIDLVDAIELELTAAYLFDQSNRHINFINPISQQAVSFPATHDFLFPSNTLPLPVGACRKDPGNGEMKSEEEKEETELVDKQLSGSDGVGKKNPKRVKVRCC
ncbi:hypothetical protein NE237_005434 [Protea cynaroides]|uniref:Uncharacterized protein n=1 Tax=Protea cynaroides TaxID=273540 RepID=A0A9Q0KKV6_9MAGN|nr:hypothetical protein NE237_005434 [Protea cynaroides]